MSAGDTWAVFTATGIVGLADFGEKGFDLVRNELKRYVADILGGDGLVSTPKISAAYQATNKIDFSGGARTAYTAAGARVVFDTAGQDWQDVPFANSGATTYYIGAKNVEVPTELASGIDGAPYFSAVQEVVGFSAAPNSVTVDGDGLILNIATLAAPGWTVAVNRRVVVWLNNPRTGGADAIYEGEAEYDGGLAAVVVNVPHHFGQSTPSTTAGDYTVAIRGPKVSTSNLSNDSTFFFIGTMISQVFSNAAQVVLSQTGVLAASAISVTDAAGLYDSTDVEAALAEARTTERHKAANTKTIATGAITVDQFLTYVDTEAAAATDDLTSIAGGVEGQEILIALANAARTVRITDGGGGANGIETPSNADLWLNAANDRVRMIHNGTGWIVTEMRTPTRSSPYVVDVPKVCPEVANDDVDDWWAAPVHAVGETVTLEAFLAIALDGVSASAGGSYLLDLWKETYSSGRTQVAITASYNLEGLTNRDKTFVTLGGSAADKTFTLGQVLHAKVTSNNADLTGGAGIAMWPVWARY